jgi:hypothetical protein
MQSFRRLLCPFLLLLTLTVRAQTNAGMPLVKDLVTHFFYFYETPNTNSYYDFQKRPEGWYVRLFDGMNGGYGTPQLYWGRKDLHYRRLDFEGQSHSDSATVMETLADRAYHWVLEAEQATRYDRNLFYGYDGWERDVMKTLEATPPTSDSSWETLAAAYDSYAGGYILPQGPWKVADGDLDRGSLSDTAAMPLSRLSKFITFENKSLSALHRIDSSNPRYQCTFHDIRGQLNTIRMAAATDLTWLGFESVTSPFVQAVAYPDSVLQRAREILRRLPPNSILFTDKDTTTFPIAYLQTKGERRDIVAIDNLILLLKRSIGYLDQKYRGTLFDVRPAVYKDSAFQMALYQADEHDTGEHRLDSFLAAIYASPDAPGLPHIDSSLRRLYRYFTRHPYIVINVPKAKQFYPELAVTGRLSFDLLDNYLMAADILNLDIVNTNLLNRHIFFTHPAEHPIFESFCVPAGPGVYEFIPTRQR